jgi:hypothetical protein
VPLPAFDEFKAAIMTQQLDLFPDRAVTPENDPGEDPLMNQALEWNAVDELCLATGRLRHSQAYLELLQFISRFPNYSPYNCFILHTQNPSLSYVATAKTWFRKFKRRPRFDARPLAILAPMGPIRFVFDINDTEGYPVSAAMLKPVKPHSARLAKIHENTVYNGTIQGISVIETQLEQTAGDTATRITPGLRKKYANLGLDKDAHYLVLLDQLDSLEDRYAALVYELGHIFCGHLGIDSNAWWSERRDLDVKGEALEAESVAFLNCQRIGLDQNARNFLGDYIPGARQLPAFSLNAVLQAVSYIEEMGKSRWSKPKKRSRY